MTPATQQGRQRPFISDAWPYHRGSQMKRKTQRKTLTGAAYAVGASFALTACVTAPPETIELSDVVAEQAASLEVAHRQAVRLYFMELERRIDTFIDSEWTPGFLAKAIQNEDVQRSLEEVQAGLSIDPERLRSTITGSDDFSELETTVIINALDRAQFDYRVQLGEIMIAFSHEVIRQIASIRAGLKADLVQSELQLMSALDEGYGNLHQGQAALRGYLQSVVQVVEQQDRILAKLRAIEARDKAMEKIIKTSETAAEAAERLDEAGQRIDGFATERNDDGDNEEKDAL